MEFTAINGLKIRYEVKGTGVPLLLLPAKGFDPWIWEKQVETLRDRFKLIMPFWPRKEELPENKSALSVEELSDAIAQLLGYAVEGRVHILGAGLGALVAQCLAVEHPELMGGLVLTSATLTSRDVYRDKNDALVLYFKTGKDAPREILESATLMELHPCSSESLKTELTDKKQEYFPDKRSFQELLLAEAAFDMRDRIGRVQADTLVVMGSEDLIEPVAVQRVLVQAVPGAQSHVIEGAGHLSFYTKSEEFNQIVASFLMARSGCLTE